MSPCINFWNSAWSTSVNSNTMLKSNPSLNCDFTSSATFTQHNIEQSPLHSRKEEISRAFSMPCGCPSLRWPLPLVTSCFSMFFAQLVRCWLGAFFRWAMGITTPSPLKAMFPLHGSTALAHWRVTTAGACHAQKSAKVWICPQHAAVVLGKLLGRGSKFKALGPKKRKCAMYLILTFIRHVMMLHWAW